MELNSLHLRYDHQEWQVHESHYSTAFMGGVGQTGGGQAALLCHDGPEEGDVLAALQGV